MVLASGTIIGGDAIGNEISTSLAQLSGRLSFDTADMKSVAADIGNWFGVKVAIADSALANRRITAMFTTPSLSEVLDAIAETTGSRYEAKGGVITFVPAPVR
jgi:ferric-dicitrate binding protein FerR (iron transport regulator)